MFQKKKSIFKVFSHFGGISLLRDPESVTYSQNAMSQGKYSPVKVEEWKNWETEEWDQSKTKNQQENIKSRTFMSSIWCTVA